MAAECPINRRVTFHMARHCYASQICLSQGIPLETVGELLGHRDRRATRICARMSREKIGEDMRRSDKRLAGGLRWPRRVSTPPRSSRQRLREHPIYPLRAQMCLRESPPPKRTDG
ncbi:MAG: tyrosine-type recombinase/integrase [Alistipes sp.]|nr:tyrosine-type recombinase/integrase [Alistipes sp.]